MMKTLSLSMVPKKGIYGRNKNEWKKMLSLSSEKGKNVKTNYVNRKRC